MRHAAAGQRTRTSSADRSVATDSPVLLIDDNEDFAESLALLLRHAGHDIRICNDPVDGIEYFEQAVPRVVLLNLGLPRLSGFEVISRIRGLAAPQPDIVVVSGYAEDADRRRALAAGADHYMVKPIDFPQLLERLNVETTG
jgi:DNA-binding response OmpR family regulator